MPRKLTDEERAARHGTCLNSGVSGYATGCRCDECRVAWREDRRVKERLRVARRVAEGFAGHEHGVRATYNLGCRCDECRAAGAEYARGRADYRRAWRAARKKP